MALLAADLFLTNLVNFRSCTLRGRTGGGKTALAFRLAYELVEKRGFRYIFSNCASVWNDRPDDMVMQNGTIDAVFVLDEAGLFLKSNADAEKYMAFMRKLNIVMIFPSVQRVPASIRFLNAQRVMNWQTVGLPMWQYKMSLDNGDSVDHSTFYWWNPSEIYGIYDTKGFPVSDNGLAARLSSWTKQAMKEAGYGEGVEIYGASTGGRRSAGSGRYAARRGASEVGLPDVETVGRLAEDLDETAEKIERSVSTFERLAKKRRVIG